MGLLETNNIVRGKIDVDENDNCSYEHGWVEFSFGGKEYVFDSLNYSIVEKQLYYEHMKPIITYRASLTSSGRTAAASTRPVPRTSSMSPLPHRISPGLPSTDPVA